MEAISGVQCQCVCLPFYQALNREQGIKWIKAWRGCLVLEAISGVQCHYVCLPLYQALNREQGIEWIKARRGCLVLEAISGVHCHCVCLPLYQALNREQGIEWIKAERLPAFLQSDLYLEYQLAKLVSQSHAINKNENQCFFRLKVLNPRGDVVRITEDDESDGSLGRLGISGVSADAAKKEEVPEYKKKLAKEKQVGSMGMRGSVTLKCCYGLKGRFSGSSAMRSLTLHRGGGGADGILMSNLNILKYCTYSTAGWGFRYVILMLSLAILKLEWTIPLLSRT